MAFSFSNFWDYLWNAYGHNSGLRLDHILLNPTIAPRLIEVGIDRNVKGWEKSSDHAPVWISLKADF
ncbi:endonuclease/exonuclease/phosphatase family protein [Olivibacter domesticus]|uniref:endonuclease/exonuclease/phosphatase family protein n=1 Tax=Olivibacter domesticus TaxID=407022 RepID=UPI00360BDADD